MAEAKAEWQKLDEAHAENVKHNRSEGAKRAAETRRRNREMAIATNDAEEIAVAVATQDAKAIIEADVADRERARELMAHLARRS
jgi:predicted RNA-binding protein with PUA domain